MSDVIDGFAEELRRQDRSDLTVKSYISDINMYARWMQETYNEEFDPSKTVRREITEYRSYLRTVTNASPATINRRLASLTKFFSYCVATGAAKENPVTGVKTIAIMDAGPKALDNVSLRRLLREVHVHGNLMHISMLEIMCGCALRVGELVNLTTSDCALLERKGMLHIRNGKGGTSRMVPLNSDVRKALEAWLAMRPLSESKFLFTGQRGDRMTPNGAWRMVKKYGQFAGITDLHPHQMRHTCLTRLVRECGTDLVAVAKISGHRSIQTLMRYSAPNQDDLANALEKLSFEK